MVLFTSFWPVGGATLRKKISWKIKKNVSKKIKEKAYHVEGLENSEWVLLDYVNVVVHVFQKHVREFYDLESLWGDAKMKRIASS